MAKAEKPAENIKSNSPADYKGTDKDVDKAKDKNPDPDKGSQQPVPDRVNPMKPEAAEDTKETPPPETAEAPEPEAGTTAGEPETPSGSHKIVIEGEGQCVIHVNGAVQYLEKGKPIKVDDATLAALDAAEIDYKKTKGK